MSDTEQPDSKTPMMQSTAESYQQTESRVVYQPTTTTITCETTTKKQPAARQSFLTRFSKIKNPLKVPEALQRPDRNSPPQMLDPNIYSTKKTVMTILCLIIIIMANSIQLKFVIKNAGTIHNQFYSAQVGLGVTSVLLAAFIGVFLMYVAMLDFNDPYEHRKLEMLNNIAIVSLFVLIVLNIFLVAFQG